MPLMQWKLTAQIGHETHTVELESLADGLIESESIQLASMTMIPVMRRLRLAMARKMRNGYANKYHNSKGGN